MELWRLLTRQLLKVYRKGKLLQISSLNETQKFKAQHNLATSLTTTQVL